MRSSEDKAHLLHKTIINAMVLLPDSGGNLNSPLFVEKKMGLGLSGRIYVPCFGLYSFNENRKRFP